ncbi:hypothetical protein ACFE04_020570 [Oxalis oulophora]
MAGKSNYNLRGICSTKAKKKVQLQDDENRSVQLLGQIRHSPCRPRAILFKVLADTTGLVSRLMVVRVCNVWEGRLPSNPDEVFCVNVLFVDEEGDEIQASCASKTAKWFRHSLRIGDIVTVARFSVEVNVRSYRYVASKYNMKLSAKTVIKKYSGPAVHIPTFSYNFVLFETLTSQSLANMQLLDVIGVVVGITYLNGNGSNLRPLPKKILRIKDISGSEIDVVLWSPFDAEIDDATMVEQAEMSRFVIAFKGMSLKNFNDVLRLSTTTGTIMATNDAISVYHEFDDIFKPSPIAIKDLRSQPVDDTHQVVEERTIAELLEMDATSHVGEVYSCKAKVVQINDEVPWWYKACRSCKRSLIAHDNFFCCDSCGITDSFSARYKVVLDVTDGTGNTSFMLFESTALQLFKFPVAKYKNGDDCYTVPVFMAHQVENIEKIFHVKFANNDGRLGGGILFIVRNIIDIEGSSSSGDGENVKMQKNEDVPCEYEENVKNVMSLKAKDVVVGIDNAPSAE